MTGVRADAPIAYVMSRFPKLTETFILFELLAVERMGQRVELYPLLRHREPVSHPEALELSRRARYQPFLSPAILRSQLYFLRHRPRAYLGALATLVRSTLGSANYLIGGLAIFPKVAHMARLMAADGVAHVHCHFANHPAAAGFLIRRLTGIPYSFVAHGSDLHVDRHMLREKVMEATFVVAISEDNANEVVAECGDWARARIRVVHCGVDTARLRPRAGDRPAGPLRIACVGTLHEVKGQAILVEACRILRDAAVDVRCRFVGDGPDEAALRARIAAAGLSDRVTLEGRLTQDEVVNVLTSADLLVAPSVPTRDGRREGIPVVLMEAMSCGLPVVASRLSGIPELVEDGICGLLVPPGDAAAVAAAVRRLADDPDLRTGMGRAARERVERNFDLATNARALLDRIRDTGPASGPVAIEAPWPADAAESAEPDASPRRPGRERGEALSRAGTTGEPR